MREGASGGRGELCCRASEGCAVFVPSPPPGVFDRVNLCVEGGPVDLKARCPVPLFWRRRRGREKPEQVGGV